MATIYKLKSHIKADDFESLVDEDYIMAFNSDTIVKFVEQPLDGEAVKFLLQNYYENPKWKEQIYDKNKKLFKKEYDLRYNKDGTIKMTETMRDLLKTWVIQIELEDGWVGFTHSDHNNRNVYYGKKILDKYCQHDIFLLLSNGFIEEVEVEDTQPEEQEGK